VVVAVVVLAVACAGAAPDTPVPDQATTSAATPTSAPAAPATSAGSTPPPTAAPAVTPMSPSVVSAKDNITLVVGEEPQNLNSHLTIGGSVYASITRANMVDPLTWQSGDDLRIVPTSATESWEQLAPDKWRFQLRQGVKFHNGEQWNAQAALPTLAYLGIAANDNPSYQYTGSYTGEAVDEYTLDITCDEACPIFPKTTFFVMFEAPNFLATTPEEQVVRQSIGFGPYKLVKWDAGVSITQEAYEDYVPVGDHFEFQKPRIRNIKWLWRGEPTVMASMVKVGEADMSWDVGVDAIKALNKDQIKTGTSAETFAMTVNTVWHPELKKKQVREAIVHAINCQEMIDTLYAGQTTCRGNIIWPGITGATERNTAPYEYNPELSKQLLAEADYDPNNLIRITGRSTRIPKQVEVYEAIQGYLEEVGMNVEINIVEPSVRSAMTRCGIGQAVAEVLEAKGKAVDTAQATMEEYQAAVDKGGANCPTGDLIENEPSNETLDFGRQVNNYMSCYAPNSLVCDTSPGGIQEQIGPALAASGKERQRLMTVLADKMHDDVLFIPGFDLPVVFAVDPRLNWQPRPDPVIRVSTMWFSP
jgi:peptide/nickel transport system substrate-binding protein